MTRPSRVTPMLFAYVAVLISTESPTGGSLQIFASNSMSLSQTTLITFSWTPSAICLHLYDLDPAEVATVRIFDRARRLGLRERSGKTA
jgi:hypothetical protein